MVIGDAAGAANRCRCSRDRSAFAQLRRTRRSLGGGGQVAAAVRCLVAHPRVQLPHDPDGAGTQTTRHLVETCRDSFIARSNSSPDRSRRASPLEIGAQAFAERLLLEIRRRDARARGRSRPRRTRAPIVRLMRIRLGRGRPGHDDRDRGGHQRQQDEEVPDAERLLVEVAEPISRGRGAHRPAFAQRAILGGIRCRRRPAPREAPAAACAAARPADGDEPTSTAPVAPASMAAPRRRGLNPCQSATRAAPGRRLSM